MPIVEGRDEPVTSDNCATLSRSAANGLAASLGERAGHLQRMTDEEKAMSKYSSRLTACAALFALLAVGAYSRKVQAQPPQQYPLIDAAAAKIV
jgi:hypothetical protein